jgi:hypothetical protein
MFKCYELICGYLKQYIFALYLVDFYRLNIYIALDFSKSQEAKFLHNSAPSKYPYLNWGSWQNPIVTTPTF